MVGVSFFLMNYFVRMSKVMIFLNKINSIDVGLNNIRFLVFLYKLCMIMSIEVCGVNVICRGLVRY